jgi:hypothetical protein
LLLVPGAGKTYVPPELDETETTVHVSPVIEIKISQTSINEVPEVEENIGGVMGFIQAFNWISYYINAEKQVVTEDYITEYWRMYVFETYVPSKNKKTTTLEIQAPGGSFFISGKAEITTDSYLFGKQTADMYEISTLPPGRTFTRSYIFVSASEDLQVNEIHIKFGYYQIAVLRELGFLPNNFSPRSITFNISTGEIY